MSRATMCSPDGTEPYATFDWASEMYASSADPGQDPRGAPDLDPLLTLLDTTYEGCGKNWYPKLSYA
jgi:predicted dithiol-disulfide oxidoreductase (DUF899 family)